MRARGVLPSCLKDVKKALEKNRERVLCGAVMAAMVYGPNPSVKSDYHVVRSLRTSLRIVPSARSYTIPTLLYPLTNQRYKGVSPYVTCFIFTRKSSSQCN